MNKCLVIVYSSEPTSKIIKLYFDLQNELLPTCSRLMGHARLLVCPSSNTFLLDPFENEMVIIIFPLSLAWHVATPSCHCERSF